MSSRKAVGPPEPAQNFQAGKQVPEWRGRPSPGPQGLLASELGIRLSTAGRKLCVRRFTWPCQGARPAACTSRPPRAGDSVGRGQGKSHWAGHRSSSSVGLGPLVFPTPLKGAPSLQSPHPHRARLDHFPDQEGRAWTWCHRPQKGPVPLAMHPRLTTTSPLRTQGCPWKVLFLWN